MRGVIPHAQLFNMNINCFVSELMDVGRGGECADRGESQDWDRHRPSVSVPSVLVLWLGHSALFCLPVIALVRGVQVFPSFLLFFVVC